MPYCCESVEGELFLQACQSWRRHLVECLGVEKWDERPVVDKEFEVGPCKIEVGFLGGPYNGQEFYFCRGVSRCRCGNVAGAAL